MCKLTKKLSSKTIATLIAGVVIVALLLVAVLTGNVTDSAWALLPPVIAIGLALITKEVFSSLFIGILSGAILANGFSFTGVVDSVVSVGLIDAVSGTAGIFVFLIELGILVALINKAGGSKAFGDWQPRPSF